MRQLRDKPCMGQQGNKELKTEYAIVLGPT